jgi:stage V sporulation protein D (sporulation-specific penicillin-binding protein)
MALSIGAQTYYSYFNAFGFTQKTNIDMLGEVRPVEGIHYHPYSVFSNPDLGGDVSLGTYGFGQTFKITPIQLITAVSAVANGGYLMEPYVVSALSDSNGNIVEKFEPKVVRQVISEETSKIMCELLESVVTIGTGKNAYVRGYRVGGKTGTSEKRDKAVQLGRDFYIASFLGVAPCDDPQVAVLVLLDEPTGYLHQGGQIAAPVVGRIMGEILPYLGVEAVYTEEELADMSIEVPDVVGKDAAEAKKSITNKKFKVEVVGDGPKVTTQYPLPGSKIPSTSTVILYCGAAPNRNQVIVPNLSGRTYADALRLLSNCGLYIDASGALGFSSSSEFKVRTQNPGHGTVVTYGSVVSVEFYSEDDIGD